LAPLTFSPGEEPAQSTYILARIKAICNWDEVIDTAHRLAMSTEEASVRFDLLDIHYKLCELHLLLTDHADSWGE
jgi:hypothetical protein